jgi:hypothetical protein
MPVSPMFRFDKRDQTPRARETPEQRAARIHLSSGRQNGAKSPGTRFERELDSFVEGQRFTTAGRIVTRADIASLQPAGGQVIDSPSRNVAPAALVLSYAVGLVPLVDERIVAVRRRGNAAFERPAHVGDTIHVEGTIDGVLAVDHETSLARMTWNVVNQRGEQIGRMEVDAIWRRSSRPAASCGGRHYAQGETAAVPT